MINESATVRRAVELLPSIGKLLFMTVARYPGVAGRSLAQIKALIHLHHHGACTVGELAAAGGVSMSTASEVADRLVDEGMIIRTSNPEDRRQVLLHPSEAATRLGEEILAMRMQQIHTMLDRLPPQYHEAVVPVLEALTDTLSDDMAAESCQSPFKATHKGESLCG